MRSKNLRQRGTTCASSLHVFGDGGWTLALRGAYRAAGNTNSMKNPIKAWRSAARHPVSAYDQKSAMLFLSPMIVVLCVVAVFPILYSFWISLFDLKLTRPHRVPFVWFDNYIKIFQDTLFWESVGRTTSFTLMSVTAIMLIALLMALHPIGRQIA